MEAESSLPFITKTLHSDVRRNLNSIMQSVKHWDSVHSAASGEFNALLGTFATKELIISRNDSISKLKKVISEFEDIISKMQRLLAESEAFLSEFCL